MPLHSEKLATESLYWIVVACNHPHIISIYGGRAQIRPDRRSEVDSPSGIDVTSAIFLSKQRQHCSCFRKGSCVQVRGVLPGVPPLFYVLLHRSSIAPMRSGQCDGSQATFQ